MSEVHSREGLPPQLNANSTNRSCASASASSFSSPTPSGDQILSWPQAYYVSAGNLGFLILLPLPPGMSHHTLFYLLCGWGVSNPRVCAVCQPWYNTTSSPISCSVCLCAQECVCACACTHIDMCLCVLASTCKPESNIWCLPQCF